MKSKILNGLKLKIEVKYTEYIIMYVKRYLQNKDNKTITMILLLYVNTWVITVINLCMIKIFLVTKNVEKNYFILRCVMIK